MPSLYKRGPEEPLPTVHVPVSSVGSNLSGDCSLMAQIEAAVAKEVAHRWEAALEKLKGMEHDMRQNLARDAAITLARAQADGFATGFGDGERALERAMHEVRTAYAELERDRLAYIEQCESEIIALAERMAARVLRSELATNPQTWIALFHEAYAELSVQRKVILFVHPCRVREVQDAKHLLPLPEEAPILVRADATLDEHSFRLEDEFGGVAYDLPEELRRVTAEVNHGVI